MSGLRESEKFDAEVTPAETRSSAGRASRHLDWQNELDSVMSDIDSRLSHPRRRASDKVAQPTLPELGQIDLTSELLDEIAWRVAELHRKQTSPVVAAAQRLQPLPAPTPTPTSTPTGDDPALWATPPEWSASAETTPALPPGAALVIRVRWPLLPWPFRRRRTRRSSQEMISLSDHGAT